MISKSILQGMVILSMLSAYIRPRVNFASAFVHQQNYRIPRQAVRRRHVSPSFRSIPLSNLAIVKRGSSTTTDASTGAIPSSALRASEVSPQQETVYALSSGGGGGTATAVAVIRITGPQSHLALQILLSKVERESYDSIKLPQARYAALRMLHDPMKSNGDSNLDAKIGMKRDPLDSSLVLLFNQPASFTGEDLIEIHSHGSRAVVQGILSALDRLSSPPYNLNIRAADRGEFTQRAYGSGKLGLVEVEALADLIVADTSYQRLQALRQMDGRLSDLYEGWRAELIKGLAHAEAVIDFGDDEDLDDDGMDSVGEMNVWGAIRPKMDALLKKMEKHLADAQRGEILRDGVKVAIVGVPNAGKSSLLNLLADRDAAIVSPIAGTTRDIVEVTLDLGGVRCIVSDTAGVRENGATDDIIEVEGIKRARKAAEEAHVLVCMVDSTDEEHGVAAISDILEDIDMDERKRNVLFVRNKIDLMKKTTGSERESGTSTIPNISIDEQYQISCETTSGVDDFIDALTQRVTARVGFENESGESHPLTDEGAVITRARHRRHVEAAAAALTRFMMRSGEGYMALDMAAEELRLTASELGRITGAVDVEDVLDVLFSDFCIGK